MFWYRYLLASWGFTLSLLPVFSAEPAPELLGYPLLVSDDFSAPGTDAWVASDPNAWRLVDQDGRRFYQQFAQSKVQTPVRSPFNRSLLKDVVVGSFVLDLQLQSTARDYPHRSLCLFFGYQDPAHMYYCHLGQKTDDHANQIFIVNGQPRTKISTKTTEGTPWDNNWHHARVVREVESGKIDVYFDDMKTPIISAVDKTFTSGQVGVGSFDDTGNFDDVRVYGVRLK